MLHDICVCQPTCSTSLAVIVVDLPGHMVNNRGEVGGSVKTHRLETLVIGLYHPLDTTAVWVLWVTILHKNKDKIVNKCGRKVLKCRCNISKVL